MALFKCTNFFLLSAYSRVRSKLVAAEAQPSQQAEHLQGRRHKVHMRSLRLRATELGPHNTECGPCIDVHCRYHRSWIEWSWTLQISENQKKSDSCRKGTIHTGQSYILILHGAPQVQSGR